MNAAAQCQEPSDHLPDARAQSNRTGGPHLGSVPPADLFDSAGWYDVGINWEARLAREIPVLRDALGPPGPRGLLDAGCGPGRHLAAMTQAGYSVSGLDRSGEMLKLARERLSDLGIDAPLIHAAFEEAPAHAGPFDGVYCIGNSLAAAGTRQAAEAAFARLASRVGWEGRLFIQVLNFEKLRRESPRVRGPRVRTLAETEYVSVRVYAFQNDQVEVTNVTLWKEGNWKQFARSGRLYALARDQLENWCAAGGLRVMALWGSYAREPFDVDASEDLILLAGRGP